MPELFAHSPDSIRTALSRDTGKCFDLVRVLATLLQSIQMQKQFTSPTKGASGANANHQPSKRLLLSTLFFLSGATSLGYEVVWFKRFANVWGSSALAMALVVGAVLLGLGLGAFLVGRRTRTISNPIRWYAVFELLIGICALLVPLAAGLLGGLNTWLTAVAGGSTVLLTLFRGFLTFLVLGIPTILMGGTLPLLVKSASSDTEEHGTTAAWMYGINTAGAATGCLLTGFWIVPMLGLMWTNIAVACVNVAIAGIAYAKGRDEESTQATKEASQQLSGALKGSPKASPPQPAASGYFLILFAAALAGFASLGLQMVWARQLAVMLGGSTYAFSASLFVFLTGVGLGALLFERLRARRADLFRLTAIVIGGLVVATVVGKLLLPTTTGIVAMVKPLRATHGLNAIVCGAAAMTLELIPALAMGVLFPIFISLCKTPNAGAGQIVGSVYGWNTIGSIFGAFFTMVVLVPAIGIPATIALNIGLYLGVLILLQLGSGGGIRGSTILALIAGVASMALASRPLDPRLTDFGSFLYGYAPPEDLKDAMKVLFFKEGRSCNVFVSETDNHRSLRVNGKSDASTATDMETQLALAYLPRALRPAATNVLVVGFGSGTTVGASLLFPETRVHCAEIEPAVIAASEFFGAVNHKPEQSPRFIPILDDGRNFLQSTTEKFDLVISEPSNPWIAGISGLFAKEFYESARRKLQSGGLFAQWVHLYALQSEDFRMIARTFRASFPHTGLLWINDKNTILVGSDQPILPPPAALGRIQQAVETVPPIRRDLERYFQARSFPALLLSRYFLDDSGFEALATADGATSLHTDINLRLEFDAPRRLFAGPIDPEKRPARAILEATGSHPALGAILSNGPPGSDLIAALRYQASIFNKSAMPKQLTKAAQLGLIHAPKDSFFLAQTIHPNAEPLAEAVFADIATRLVEASPDEAAKAGGSLWQKQRYAEAAKLFETLVQRHPNSATGWMGLAMNLRSLGRTPDAEKARKRALELDPMIGLLRSSMTALESQASAGGRNTLAPSGSETEKPEP